MSIPHSPRQRKLLVYPYGFIGPKLSSFQLRRAILGYCWSCGYYHGTNYRECLECSERNKNRHKLRKFLEELKNVIPESEHDIGDV